MKYKCKLQYNEIEISFFEINILMELDNEKVNQIIMQMIHDFMKNLYEKGAPFLRKETVLLKIQPEYDNYATKYNITFNSKRQIEIKKIVRSAPIS